MRSMAPSSATTLPILLRERLSTLSPVGAGSELPPEPGVTYAAFCDPSGGISDSMTLAVAHLRDGAICVLDAILECRPPFDPEIAVAECTAVLRRFGVTKVVSDKYAGDWPKARFAEHGIALEQSAKPKSDIYHDLLPLLNARRVELLDNPRLASQLVGLERRTSRQGKDSDRSFTRRHMTISSTAWPACLWGWISTGGRRWFGNPTCWMRASRSGFQTSLILS